MRMTEKAKAVFAEAKSPKHAGLADAQKMLQPIVDALAKLRAQVAEHRGLVIAAEVGAETDDYRATRGHTARLHQSLDSADAAIRAASDAIRKIPLCFEQYSRYCGEIVAATEKKATKDAVAVAGPGKT